MNNADKALIRSMRKMDKITDTDILDHLLIQEPATRTKAKTARKEYSESFEAFWRAYYVSFGTKGQKKPLAFKAWQKITDEDREAALKSLPQYKAHLKKTEYAYQHVSTYLNGRTWESFEAPVLDLVAAERVYLYISRPDHSFLEQCRCDGACESDLREWSQNKFTVRSVIIGGKRKSVCVVSRDLGGFEKAFSKTKYRLLYSVWNQSTWDREMGKQA